MKPLLSLGLMTGTVLDGFIDMALLYTDGQTIEAFAEYRLMPYDASVLPLLKEALVAAAEWQFNGPPPAIFNTAERALTLAQCEAIQAFLQAVGVDIKAIDVVGFHGQTVLHAPPVQPQLTGRTRQLGDGRLMSQTLGLPVVNNFREADMRAGGQGAPLAVVYHAALLARAGLTDGRTAVLNLGGVGNLSWWSGEPDLAQPGALAAFDTGPANAPINDFVGRFQAEAMDRDGHLATAGTLDQDRLAALLDDAYFQRPYPKSLDRQAFTADLANGCSLQDGARLLTVFAASAVERGLRLLPQTVARLVVCGGGRHNPVMMQALRARIGAEVMAAEAIGWRGDALEAECFAYLAVRSLQGLPLSFPSTTGAREAVCGGEHWQPEIP